MTEVVEARDRAVAPQADSASVLEMIERASRDPTVDVDKFERMLAMAERVNAAASEREFNAAMSAVKKEMPQVLRNAENDHSKARYATLDAVSRTMDPIISNHGFSLSFGTSDCPLANHYRVTCLVSHLGGFTRPYFFDLPIDATGSQGKSNKTAIQASGSTISYGRRYLKLMIFDVTLTNDDNDGNGAPPAQVTEDQAGDLQALIDDVGANRTAFLKHFGIQSVSSMPAARYAEAVRMLEAKRARR